MFRVSQRSAEQHIIFQENSQKAKRASDQRDFCLRVNGTLPNKLMINFPPPSRPSRHGGFTCTQHKHQSVPDPCDSSAAALFNILRMEPMLFLTWRICCWSVVLVTDAVYSLVNWILQEPLFTQEPITNSLSVQLLSNRSIHPLIKKTTRKRGHRRTQTTNNHFQTF